MMPNNVGAAMALVKADVGGIFFPVIILNIFYNLLRFICLNIFYICMTAQAISNDMCDVAMERRDKKH